MVIYKITNIINGLIYIGKDVRNRKNYFGSGKLLKEAISKFGQENFMKEIIDTAENKEELTRKEINWIFHFKSFDRLIGYNISLKPGDSTSHHPNKEQIYNNIRIAKLSKIDNNGLNSYQRNVRLGNETKKNIVCDNGKTVYQNQNDKRVKNITRVQENGKTVAQNFRSRATLTIHKNKIVKFINCTPEIFSRISVYDKELCTIRIKSIYEQYKTPTRCLKTYKKLKNQNIITSNKFVITFIADYSEIENLKQLIYQQYNIKFT